MGKVEELLNFGKEKMTRRIKKNKERLDLFWKIANYVNKEHCKGKLDVKEIIISKKGYKKGILGCYSAKTKNIWMKEDLDPVHSIKVLIHELAHAYQMTFYQKQYHKWVDFHSEEMGKINENKYNEIVHDALFNHIGNKFLKSMKNKISVRFEC